jgi:RhtB (resistance to homoserine/threonine) family protein
VSLPFDARFAAWLAIAVVLIVTPGPDTALIIRNALRGGARAASLSAFGVALGSSVWAVASILGVAVLLESSDLAFTVFKLAGAAYLIYLGLRSVIGSFRPQNNSSANRVSTTRSRLEPSSFFAQGLLNNLFNPKAGAIFVTVMPQFIEPHDSAIRLILMVACYDAMVVAWLCMYGYVVSRAGRSRMGARVRKGVERVTGAVMIGLGVRLAFERR